MNRPLITEKLIHAQAVLVQVDRLLCKSELSEHEWRLVDQYCRDVKEAIDAIIVATQG